MATSQTQLHITRAPQASYRMLVVRYYCSYYGAFFLCEKLPLCVSCYSLVQRLCRVGGVCKAVKMLVRWGCIRGMRRGKQGRDHQCLKRKEPSELLSPERWWRWWRLRFGTAVRGKNCPTDCVSELYRTSRSPRHPLRPPRTVHLVGCYSLCCQPWRRETQK